MMDEPILICLNSDVKRILTEFRVDSHVVGLSNLGVSNKEDLLDVGVDDLESLGFTKIEKNRFGKIRTFLMEKNVISTPGDGCVKVEPPQTEEMCSQTHKGAHNKTVRGPTEWNDSPSVPMSPLHRVPHCKRLLDCSQLSPADATPDQVHSTINPHSPQTLLFDHIDEDGSTFADDIGEWKNQSFKFCTDEYLNRASQPSSLTQFRRSSTGPGIQESPKKLNTGSEERVFFQDIAFARYSATRPPGRAPLPRISYPFKVSKSIDGVSAKNDMDMSLDDAEKDFVNQHSSSDLKQSEKSPKKRIRLDSGDCNSTGNDTEEAKSFKDFGTSGTESRQSSNARKSRNSSNNTNHLSMLNLHTGKVSNSNNQSDVQDETMEDSDSLAVVPYQGNALQAAVQMLGSRMQATTVLLDSCDFESAPPDGFFIVYKSFSSIEKHEKRMVSGIDPTKCTVEDLIRFILTSEKQELHVTAELYTKEGIPLSADRYFRKWTLVERIIICGDLIYVIFRQKKTSEDDLKQHSGLADSGNSVVLCNLMIKGTFQMNVNLETDTIFNLKQKLFSKSGVPPAVQNMSYDGTELNDSNTLTSSGIEHIDCIQVSLCCAEDNAVQFGWQYNFQLPAPLAKQSDRGLQMFAAVLYAVASHNHTKATTKNVLGFIRRLSCCPPLVAALDLLMRHKMLTKAQKVAITEGLFWLFKRMLPAKVEGQPDNSGVEPFCVLEYSNLCWAYLLSKAKASDGNTENYKLVDLVCPLSHARLLEPVKAPGVGTCYERHVLINRALGGLHIPGCTVKQLLPWHLTRDKETEKLLQCTCKSWMQCHVWEATPPCLSQRLPELEGVSIKLLQDLVSDFKYLKIHPPLQLKEFSVKEPVLTLNEASKVVLYTGRGKGVASITLFDPISQCNEYEEADSLAKSLSDYRKSADMVQMQFSRPPAEAIVVLLDASKSMDDLCYWYCNNCGNMTRLEAVKQLFHAFANRSMAYNFAHVIGLTVFGSQVNVVTECTEIFESFKKDVDEVQTCGRTALYDALMSAASQLETLACTYPQCIKRILALTDGYDNRSRKSLVDVTKTLQKQNVVVDSVLVGEGNLNLKAVSVATGGCSFFPKHLAEAFKLFEMETVLSLRTRVTGKKPPKVKDEDSIKRYYSRPFETQPAHKTPTDINTPVTLPHIVLKKISLKPPQMPNDPQSSGRSCRLLKEISQYQRKPHASIHIFPCETNVGFWRVLLVGPPNTPYENGVFLLYADFPENYPTSPPEVRFITPIYHCNVNSSGRICHSIFDRNYTSDCNVSDNLTCVYGLLVTPEPDDPLDSTLAEEYHSNKGLYIANATDHAQQHASKSLIQWKEDMLGDNTDLCSLPPPRDLICPLTHEVYVDPVRTPYGYIYERNAIEAYLEKHRKDPLSYEPLENWHLTNDQIMKRRVEDFRRSQVQVNNPWWEK